MAAAALVWITVTLPTREGARLQGVDLVAIAALLVAAVALASGAADEDRLARGQGPALLLLLLPGLLAIVAAIGVARVFPAIARWWSERKRSALSARLAAVGLARGPGGAVATVAFLTIAFALALLAEGYRATLAQGERDQAAFEVPLDVVVREDLQNLVRVFDVAPERRFAQLAGVGGAAYPVLRVTGGAGRAERVSGVTVLGLDPAAIERVGVWRPEWSSGRSLHELSDLVGSRAPGRAPRAPARPAIASSSASLRASSRSRRSFASRTDGSVASRSEQADARSRVVLRKRLPAGALLVSLEIVPPPRLIERGADSGNAFVADLRFSGPLATQLREWVGVGGVVTRSTPTGVAVRVPLTLFRSSFLRSPQPTDASPASVLVTPRLAELAGGVGGMLPLQLAGATVPVQVAGIVQRFPGAAGDVVVGDRVELRTAIDTASPGGARENEVWLDVPPDRVDAVAAALARPPYRALATTVRSEVEAEAHRDPLARGTLLALISTAIVALVLASLGLALAVRADLRDDRGEHYDLEAQGSSPTFLRRVVRVRAASLSAVGARRGRRNGSGTARARDSGRVRHGGR